MKTAEALEAITDRGRFECLVISVLRRDNKDYAHILQTGVNAAGEPVISPVDGFCRVPGSAPAHFLMVQVTSTERESLERKWLYDSTVAKERRPVSTDRDGDLVKTGRLAQKIRRDFPHAQFTVILGTNQRIDADLQVKVYRKAEDFYVDCDIWDQSRLAGFLDNRPEGHWLRKQYLGIEAEMLSDSLLHSLCKRSLVLYEKELFLTNPDNWVSRGIDDRVHQGICSNTHTIEFLVGESGFGKTVAAYRALQKHLASGGYGLWAPAELIKECMFLENALDSLLLRLHPGLLPNPGKDALLFVQEHSQFLIVVDDINRIENPTELVRKLLAWSKPQRSHTPDLQSPFPSTLVVCPVWPHLLTLTHHDVNKTPWAHTVSIGPMTAAEGALAVRATAKQAQIEITNTQANALAKKMENDPILIGLFGSLLDKNKPCDFNTLVEDVMEEFIRSSVEEVAFAPNALHLRTDYRNTLSTLISHMLIKRRLHPFWKEVESWLERSPDILKALRELIQHGKLCRLTSQEQFVFRHDRIQETLLIESMAAMLANTVSGLDILGEPFYSEIIGRALVASPQNREFLKKMADRLPLALIEAVRYFGAPTSDYHHTIVEEAKKWAETSVAIISTPDTVLNAVCWSLVETDSPAVLEITETFPKKPLVLLARLRNGCAKSGALYCTGRPGLAPSINDSLRDQILEQTKWRHREKLLRELKQLLKCPASTDEVREGALALAGFLGFTDLQDDIRTCWKLVTDKTRVLSEAIWAAIHCCGAEPNKLLDPLMVYWAELSDEKDSLGMSAKGRIADALHFAMARGVRDDVINYLIAECDVHDSLREPITFMCDRIDAPVAIEFIVRTAADIERSIVGTDKFSPWTLMLADNWNFALPRRRRLSQASMARLKALWQDPKKDGFVEKQAFRLWCTGIEWKQIGILRAIPSNSPLYRSALWKRTQLGDHSVVPDLLPLLMTKTRWFMVAHHVWCKQLMVKAQHHLEAFKDNIPTNFSGGLLDVHHVLSKLLMMIPVNDAEILLAKYWTHLRYSPLFVQTALYVGTPKCLKLGASSISQCPRHVDIFKRIDFEFGFMDSERQKHLTEQRLDNLLPYVDRLGEDELSGLVEVCQRIGIPKWPKQHLSDQLSEKDRKRYYPSDDDLFRNLDQFVADKHGVWSLKYWLEEFDKRHDPRDRALGIMNRWLASHPTVQALKIAAACVQTIGARGDLSLLEKYRIEGRPDEVVKIKENTRFFVQRRTLD